jgi:hypothetical protein
LVSHLFPFLREVHQPSSAGVLFRSSRIFTLYKQRL